MYHGRGGRQWDVVGEGEGKGLAIFRPWLLQKQKEGERPPKEAVSLSEKGQFHNAPTQSSRLVLFNNTTAPGDVDEDLASSLGTFI